MEPTPETRYALEEYGEFVGDGRLLQQLLRSAELVRGIVPSCVGITLALVREGIAFTVVATDETVAVLDGLQYVEGGPCLASAESGQQVTFTADDPIDEDRWAAFARITAARGIASTLTLPILEESSVLVRGTVNLYAADPCAFDGHHQEVAGVFGAWASGAVQCRPRLQQSSSRPTGAGAPEERSPYQSGCGGAHRWQEVRRRSGARHHLRGR